MIKLGSYDSDLTQEAITGYFVDVKNILDIDIDEGKQLLRGEKNAEWIPFVPYDGSLKIATIQKMLRSFGFYPADTFNGICGYRTSAGIRLFQEYNRVFHPEILSDYPDGIVGSRTTAAIETWASKKMRANWMDVSADSPTAEFTQWIQVIRDYKHRSINEPSPLMKKGLKHRGVSSTLNPEKWIDDPTRIHLIGIRHNLEAPLASRRFDDLFVLLINGLAFMFRGSTEPGASSHPKGAPYLIPGQHLYGFGWHKISNKSEAYHALRPQKPGVLIVRALRGIEESANNVNASAELNSTINIHWGGTGRRSVANWSEGCQVISGDRYINHHHHVVECSAFSAINDDSLGKRVNGALLTKGAYSVITDLVAALPGRDRNDRTILYTLINLSDLSSSPEITDLVGQSLEMLGA